MDLAAVWTYRSSAEDCLEKVEAVDAALHLSGIAAVAFKRAVDGADRAAEAGIIDDATMGWLSSRAALRHPVPHSRSPGNRWILFHQIRICPEI